MKRSPMKRGDGFARKTYAEALASRKPRRGKHRPGIRIDPADRYFSLYIRYKADWRCERCGTQYEAGSQGLHASHFWSRGRESTRFDPINVSAHCFFCHTELGGNPELHRAWKLKQIGQKDYDLLMIRAETTQKKDRPLMALIYKKLYQEEKVRFDSIAA